jgi:hypothetical protein
MRDEVRTRDAGDEVGVIDSFFRWWTTAVAGLFTLQRGRCPCARTNAGRCNNIRLRLRYMRAMSILIKSVYAQNFPEPIATC